MLCWLNHKLESRLPGEISTISDRETIPLMAQSRVELKSLSMKEKEESEAAGLKLNIQKTKIMASSPITSMQTVGANNGNSDRLYFLGLQNHCSW